MNLASRILKWFGWTVNITVPDLSKAIICVAPHTSNWDFIVGKLAYAAAGRHAGFLMKSTWFFPPLGWIFKAMGGVPVYRGKSSKEGSLTDQLVERFNTSSSLVIAITPEGTRSRTSQWHTGFLRIAHQTGVPILLAKIDYKLKRAEVTEEFHSTGDIECDMRSIKEYYRGASGKHPELFTID